MSADSLLLALVLLLFAALIVRRQRTLARPVRLALLGHLGLWAVWPLTYVLLDATAREESVAQPHFPLVVVAHVACLLAVVAGVILLPARAVDWVGRTSVGTRPLTDRTVRLWLALAVTVVIPLRIWQFQTVGGDFLSLISANVGTEKSELGAVTAITAVAVVGTSFAMAVVASDNQMSLRGATRWWGYATLVVLAMQQVIFGTRAFLLTPVLGGILLLAPRWQRLSRTRKLTSVALGAMLLAIAAPVALVLGAARGVQGAEREAATEAAALLGELTPAEQAQLTVRAAYVKFDALGTGASLIARDGTEFAGWQPITSALLAPIPRLLLPNKPVPTSFNGEQSGIPYVRAALDYGDIDLGMVVPVSASAVMLWELGYGGLPLFVFVNVLTLRFADAMLRSRSVLLGGFGIVLLAFPTFEYVVQPVAGIIRDGLRIGLYFLLATGALLFARRDRVEAGNADSSASTAMPAD